LIALGKMRLNDTYGVDVENAEIREMLEVLEPTEVKRQAYTIATEYSNNILRIGFILQGRAG
jgi:chaperonin GroEL (HSP60 family)